MNLNLWEISFLVGQFTCIVIRIPFDNTQKKNEITDNRKTNLEKALLLFVAIGMLIVPLVHIFSPWLNFASYYMPFEMGWLGVVSFLFGIWLFWRSHVDLDKNWSPTLQIRKSHDLVTNGVYRYIRHPMYTSIWLWAIAQIFLLHNWIAGFSGFVSFGCMYFLRVAKEEKMMIDHFGQEYFDYMKKTGRIFPKLIRNDVGCVEKKA